MRRSLALLLGLGALAGADCSRANLDAIRPGQVADAGHDSSRTTDSSLAVTCPAKVLAPGDGTRTVLVDSQSRSYVLHVPDSYDGSKPVPLIVDFHALTGSGNMEQTVSRYAAATESDGVIMAFPDGLSGPIGAAWNVGPCCVGSYPDDVGFAKKMVDQVRSLACIDPNHIYAVGPSMGGGMAYWVACHAADVFAAVSAWGFDLMQENVDDCKPSRPITVISFRAKDDPLVSYAGGQSNVVPGMAVTFLGAEDTFAKWAELDHCTGAPSTPDGNGCSSWSGCPGGANVILCTKATGGQAYNDADLGWQVLKGHSLQ